MKFLESLRLPEVLSALGMIVTALAGYWTAKSRSRSQLKIKEVDARTTLTLKEQESMAKRQDQLSKQQKDFMNQMRDEMRLLREELNEERKRSTSLEGEVRDWRDKYLTILEKYQELVAENGRLRDKLEEYELRVSELELELKIKHKEGDTQGSHQVSVTVNTDQTK
ncbi:hypothetical protein SP15_067 [Bacillus phage SP-15]|uniref:Uncharacterized protein n=1 Tax=Bacillus phage SP-15 TaxID=1792032 RepID=A0A127AW11_9CAUD|nr:hypothetical protein SP15_067 [Bacillus phage SP-15]AMM44866.1 hypothetical protein SP15_067 [Bacillus phage SP-15]